MKTEKHELEIILSNYRVQNSWIMLVCVIVDILKWKKNCEDCQSYLWFFFYAVGELVKSRTGRTGSFSSNFSCAVIRSSVNKFLWCESSCVTKAAPHICLNDHMIAITDLPLTIRVIQFQNHPYIHGRGSRKGCSHANRGWRGVRHQLTSRESLLQHRAQLVCLPIALRRRWSIVASIFSNCRQLVVIKRVVVVGRTTNSGVR